MQNRGNRNRKDKLLHFLLQDLLRRVTPYIKKKTTRLRKPLSPGEKLACTLRYLATGESYESLHFQFRISTAAISLFIPEVCDSIYLSLKDEHLVVPSTADEWRELSDLIYQYWQFPNCIGAMDGKHLAMFCPDNSGSTFFNYKNFHSIVLLALVKHNYQFIYFDVGCQGRISDGGVFRNSDLYEAISTSLLNLPPPTPLPKTGDPCWDEDEYPDIPYVIVGDNAFQLSKFLMKPYSRKNLDYQSRVFNYRLSRFRRVSENAFGILVARFRLFLQRIYLEESKVIQLTRAACVLHNLLCEKSKESYAPPYYVDQEQIQNGCIIPGQWREEIPNDFFQKDYAGCRGTRVAEEIRNNFKQFFAGPGAVPWQDKMLS